MKAPELLGQMGGGKLALEHQWLPAIFKGSERLRFEKT